MDGSQAIKLSSTWKTSGTLQAILHVKKKSDACSVESVVGDGGLVLTAQEGQSCFLHVDLSALSGSVVCGVELVSQARTVEVYEGSGLDYVTTVKGITHGSDQKLYSCACELAKETHYGKISLKLLSLGDKTQVIIQQLIVEISEYSETKQESSHAPPLLPNQFLASLSSRELPPFLRTLVTSLQGVPQENTTSDVSKMADAFRQVHNALSQTKEPVAEAPVAEVVREVDAEPLEQQTLAALLEEKLKRYIDEKFADFERRIESKLEALSARIGGPRAESMRQSHQSGLIDDLTQLD